MHRLLHSSPRFSDNRQIPTPATIHPLGGGRSFISMPALPASLALEADMRIVAWIILWIAIGFWLSVAVNAQPQERALSEQRSTN